MTRPALWSIVPDPFDLTVDSRTWKHYTDSVDYRAREVTGHVNPACMLSNLRRNNQGDLQEHSLSDVDRAAKRVDAWTRVMISPPVHSEDESLGDSGHFPSEVTRAM